MEYRNVQIKLNEVDTYVRKNADGTVGTFTNGDGLVFVASSKFGETFGTNGPDALRLQHKLIDEELG